MVADFFITSTFTLVMSTFWLNSGGNFVCLINFRSCADAMTSKAVNVLARQGAKGRYAEGLRWVLLRGCCGARERAFFPQRSSS